MALRDLTALLYVFVSKRISNCRHVKIVTWRFNKVNENHTENSYGKLWLKLYKLQIYNTDSCFLSFNVPQFCQIVNGCLIVHLLFPTTYDTFGNLIQSLGNVFDQVVRVLQTNAVTYNIAIYLLANARFFLRCVWFSSLIASLQCISNFAFNVHQIKFFQLVP